MLESKKGCELVPSDTSLVPISKEVVSTTALLVDRVQGIIERAYDLNPRGLRRASDFLWPRKTSANAEIFARDAQDKPNSTCYVSDKKFLEGGWITTNASWMHQPQTWSERMNTRYNPRRLAFRAGVLPYEGINSVIFLHRGIMGRIETPEPAQMLDQDYIHDLELVTEQVSHFLYEQVQYRTHRKFAGKIMSAAIAVLDWYLVLKNVPLNPDNKGAMVDNKVSVKSLVDNINSRLELNPFDFSLNPWTTHFRKGVTILGGFVGHIIKKDKQGEDNTPELHQFYLMPPRNKLEYLEVLYEGYVKNGDERYKSFLAEVRDRLAYEYEFRDPKAPFI